MGSKQVHNYRNIIPHEIYIDFLDFELWLHSSTRPVTGKRPPARHRCRPIHLFMTNTLNWPRLCCVARDLIHTTGSPEFKFTVTTFDWWLCFTTGRIDDPELYNILLVDLQQFKLTCLSSHSHALLPQRGNNNETIDQSPIQQLRAEIPQTGMEVKDQFAS